MFLALVAVAARAADHRPLDHVVAAYYPPLMIADSPTNAGVAIEILRIAADRAGRDIEIEFVPFQRALHALDTRDDTLMPALFRNASREDKYRWIATYDAAELNFLTMTQPINTLAEGRALNRIAVETDSSADRFLTGQGFENLVRLANPASSARMLHAGRVDAWVQSGTAATVIWGENSLAPALQIGDPVYSVPIFLTAGLSYPDEAALAYQTAILGMVADGTVASILARYR
jgi:polar amino acid transport system substrate-binding protein